MPRTRYSEPGCSRPVLCQLALSADSEPAILPALLVIVTASKTPSATSRRTVRLTLTFWAPAVIEEVMAAEEADADADSEAPAELEGPSLPVALGSLLPEQAETSAISRAVPSTTPVLRERMILPK